MILRILSSFVSLLDFIRGLVPYLLKDGSPLHSPLPTPHRRPLIPKDCFYGEMFPVPSSCSIVHSLLSAARRLPLLPPEYFYVEKFPVPKSSLILHSSQRDHHGIAESSGQVVNPVLPSPSEFLVDSPPRTLLRERPDYFEACDSAA